MNSLQSLLVGLAISSQATISMKQVEPKITSPDRNENGQNHSAELKQMVNTIYAADSLTESPPVVVAATAIQNTNIESPESPEEDTPNVTARLDAVHTPPSTMLNFESPTTSAVITVKKNESSSLLKIPDSIPNSSGKQEEVDEFKQTVVFCPRQESEQAAFYISKLAKRRKPISKHKVKVNRFARKNLNIISIDRKTKLLD